MMATTANQRIDVGALRNGEAVLTAEPAQASLRQQIALRSIQTDGGTQMRAALNQDTVEEYRSYMAENGWGDFDPVVVYYDGAAYWLSDGFHRIEAYRRVGVSVGDTLVPAIVHAGARRDAILHAAGANARHGLRRTNADKRRAVEVLLRDEEWSQWSDEDIARRCAVGRNFVTKVRSEISPSCTPSASQPIYRTVMRNGKPIQMNVAAIGNREKSRPLTNEERHFLTRAPQPGIYVLEHNGRCKIGWSRTPFSRVSELLTQNPDAKISIVASGEIRDERRIHGELQCERDIGEWFICLPIDVIQAMAKCGIEPIIFDADKRTIGATQLGRSPVPYLSADQIILALRPVLANDTGIAIWECAAGRNPTMFVACQQALAPERVRQHELYMALYELAEERGINLAGKAVNGDRPLSDWAQTDGDASESNELVTKAQVVKYASVTRLADIVFDYIRRRFTTNAAALPFLSNEREYALGVLGQSVNARREQYREVDLIAAVGRVIARISAASTSEERPTQTDGTNAAPTPVPAPPQGDSADSLTTPPDGVSDDYSEEGVDLTWDLRPDLRADGWTQRVRPDGEFVANHPRHGQLLDRHFDGDLVAMHRKMAALTGGEATDEPDADQLLDERPTYAGEIAIAYNARRAEHGDAWAAAVGAPGTKAQRGELLATAITPWILEYKDKYDRTWRDLAAHGNPSHSNSTFWDDIRREIAARKLMISDGVLKMAIKRAFEMLEASAVESNEAEPGVDESGATAPALPAIELPSHADAKTRAGFFRARRASANDLVHEFGYGFGFHPRPPHGDGMVDLVHHDRETKIHRKLGVFANDDEALAAARRDLQERIAAAVPPLEAQATADPVVEEPAAQPVLPPVPHDLAAAGWELRGNPYGNYYMVNAATNQSTRARLTPTEAFDTARGLMARDAAPDAARSTWAYWEAQGWRLVLDRKLQNTTGVHDATGLATPTLISEAGVIHWLASGGELTEAAYRVAMKQPPSPADERNARVKVMIATLAAARDLVAEYEKTTGIYSHSHNLRKAVQPMIEMLERNLTDKVTA